MVGLRTVFAILLAATLATLALSSQKTVTVWGTSFGPDSKGFESAVREFERLHPDTKVLVTSMGAGRTDPQKLMTAIVGNAAPDVIKQDRFSVGDWASRNAFESLNTFMERDKGDPLCPNQSQYYDAPWQEARYQGSVYAIPESADNRALYWNREVFRRNAEKLRELGLDPNRPPRSWTELLRYSRALTEFYPDGRLKTAGFIPTYGNTSLYLYGFQTEAKFLSSDGMTCTMSEPGCVEALQFMQAGFDLLGGWEKAQILQSGFQSGVNDPFLNGRVAMKIDGDWIIKDIAKNSPGLDFGVAPPPSPDERLAKTGRYSDVTDPFVTWSGGYSWAIPKGAKNPNGGWEFIKFITSTRGRMVAAESAREWERRRGREYVVPVSASREFNALAFEKLAPVSSKLKAALAAHIELSKVGRCRPVSTFGQKLWDEHIRAQERALMGLVSIEQALKDAQTVVQSEIDTATKSRKLPAFDERLPVRVTLLALIVAGVLLVVGSIRSKLGALQRKEAKWGFLLISPWLIGFALLVLGPMIASFFYSFTWYPVLSPAKFAGTENYQAIASTDWPNFGKAMSNAAYLAVVGVPLGTATGLAIALLLNSGAKGIAAYRSMFFMPSILPAVASAILWVWILTADPNKGLINSLWSQTIQSWFGVLPPTWLGSEAWSKPALILQGLWGAGGGMLLWLAGLKGIPKSLYEAADLDGASSLRKFSNVTFPMLSPFLFFQLVMGFIGSIQEFDRVYVMDQSDGSVGPNDSLLMPAYHLFQNGFGYFKMGYASALAWTMFAIIAALTYVQFRLRNKWVHEEVDK